MKLLFHSIAEILFQIRRLRNFRSPGGASVSHPVPQRGTSDLHLLHQHEDKETDEFGQKAYDHALNGHTDRAGNNGSSRIIPHDRAS